MRDAETILGIIHDRGINTFEPSRTSDERDGRRDPSGCRSWQPGSARLWSRADAAMPLSMRVVRQYAVTWRALESRLLRKA